MNIWNEGLSAEKSKIKFTDGLFYEIERLIESKQKTAISKR